MIVRDLASGDEREFVAVGAEAAFAWSPTDNRTLAVAQRAQVSSFVYDGLSLFDTQTGLRRSAYSGGVLAFYWSPDGSKLALATTAPDQPLEWTVVDAESGDATTIASFAPSADFLTHLQFFDQFAPSHTIWSSDSQAIVFAGAVLDAAPGRGSDQAWVLDATAEFAPRPLADAGLAFFVPAGE